MTRSEFKAAVPMLFGIGVLVFFPWTERAIAAVLPNEVSDFIFNNSAYFCIFLTCVAYGASLRYLYRWLRHVDRDLPDVWFLFLIASVSLCFCFALYLDVYLMLPTWTEGTTVHQRNLGDAFYFATVTFTTLGYGDIVPISPVARIMASFIAIFGVTHAVTFITVIVQTAFRKN